MSSPPVARGRGSASNPKNRFETIERVPEPPDTSDETPSLHTQFFADASKSIIAYNDSPDVGFDASINVYRGCEHGCVYCYARPTHEYLGFSSGLDFESKILVKEEAPELLRRELSRLTWKPQVIGMSGVTDCYQPLRETPLHLAGARRAPEFRNPVMIVTKLPRYQDIDVSRRAARRYQCAAVTISLTTLDAKLSFCHGNRALPA
jgi:DNA repair photolyase